MLELLVLIAVMYAGARGVESAAGTADRRHDTREAQKTVAKVAASGPKDGPSVKKSPGPTEPGGTFSSSAPRSAAIGGKAAVPLAVLTETSSTMWKAIGEGYRARWPEIRAERRKQMAERAEKRKAERTKTETERKAAEAVAKAGPPPAYPPPPAEPPKTEDPKTVPDGEKATPAPDETKPTVVAPEPRPADAERIEAAEKRAKNAEDRARAAEQDAATSKVLAAQKEAREAKEREAAAEERARAAEARTAQPTERPHLTVVPNLDTTGVDMASSPHTLIPEIRTLDGLLNALALVRAMAEMRAEEAAAIAGDDLALSNRLDEIEASLAAEDVDAATLADLAELRESIANQSKAAAQYSGTAKDAADIAQAVAEAAKKTHGGIAEAIQSAPIEKAAKSGHYNR
ncbi:hypothetical protein ACH4TX_41765 [Streptomyces sp. NPDC021098]|uniref:hypothetical protein n=1 Tax=unclassified Streptomyces TaxID=2593676 RepID=UPI0037AD85C3